MFPCWLADRPPRPPLLRFCLSFQNTPGIPSSCGDLRLAQRAPPASSEGSLEDLSGRAEGRHRVSRVLVVFCRGPFVLIESGPVLRPGKRDRKSPGGCVHRLSVDTPSRGFSVPFSGPCFGDRGTAGGTSPVRGAARLAERRSASLGSASVRGGGRLQQHHRPGHAQA